MKIACFVPAYDVGVDQGTLDDIHKFFDFVIVARGGANERETLVESWSKLLDCPVFVLYPRERLSGDPKLLHEIMENICRQPRAESRVNGAENRCVRVQWTGPGCHNGGGSWQFRIYLNPQEWNYTHDIGCELAPKDNSIGVTPFELQPEVIHIVSDASLPYMETKERIRQELLANYPVGKDEWERRHIRALADKVNAPAELSLCVIVKDLGDKFQRMIRSTIGHFDEYVIVATYPVDWADLPDLRSKVITDYYQVSYMVDLPGSKSCIGDFAEARNHCFSLATGRWRMFLDSDDELVWSGKSAAPKLLSVVRAWEVQPQAFNCVSLPYHYLYDEAGKLALDHDRVRIFKWSDELGRPLWQWVSPIHETCEASEFNPALRLKTLRLPGEVFVVRHDGDVEGSVVRNGYVAAAALDRDEPRPPSVKARLLYAYHSPLMGQGDEGSIQALRTLAEEQPDLTHGFMAGLDVARKLLDLDRFDESASLLEGLIRRWPDSREALRLLASTSRRMGDKPRAAECFAQLYIHGTKADGLNYRSLPLEEDEQGRLEAVDFYLEEGLWAWAKEILLRFPQEDSDSWKDRLLEAQSRLSDAEVSESLLKLVQYYLSLDCAEDALSILDTAPVFLRRSKQFKLAHAAAWERAKHLHSESLYFDDYNKLGEAELGMSYFGHRDVVVERALEFKPRTFIDIGCNTGAVALRVASLLPDCLVIGIDVGEVRAQESQLRADHLGLTNCTFLAGKAEEADKVLGLRATDHPIMVSCTEVLEHVNDPAAAVQAIANLHPDRVAVTVPDIEAYHNLVSFARRTDIPIQAIMGKGKEGGHVRCYDAHELVRLLQPVGIEAEFIERVESPGIAGRPYSVLLLDGKPARQHPQGLLLDIHAQGYTPFGPTYHKNHHSGGSEQAIIHLMPELHGLGHEVHVYAAPMDRLEYEQGVFWHTASEFDPEPSGRDALLLWRRVVEIPGMIRAAKGAYPVILWAHDVPMEEWSHLYDKANAVFVVSKFHKETFLGVGNIADESKIHVLQNGIVRSSIEQALTFASERDPHRCIYGSSADRGLLPLLRMWPQVLADFPDARLEICYRMDLMRGPAHQKVARTCLDLIRDLPGVTYHGGLPHQEFLNLAARCGVWPYLCTFPEVSCITAMEMQALGVWPVSLDTAALRETLLGGVVISSDKCIHELFESGMSHDGKAAWAPVGCHSPTYLAHLLDALSDPPTDEDRNHLSNTVISRYDWARTAQMFDEAIRGLA